MKFATTVEISIDLQEGSGDHFGPLISSQIKIAGATWTENAMDVAFEDVFKGNIDSTRIQKLILVTDGSPSVGQDPCRALDQYALNNGKTFFFN